MGIVEQYFLQLNKKKRQWRRAAVVLTVLAILVAIAVSWNLRMTGVTIANGATCGIEEHLHTEDCFMAENQCTYEEHTHGFLCYSDETEDVETAVIWEENLPELTNQWAEDVVSIAQSQLGTGESERNFVIAEDGETKNGITRYGQWYGNPYGDWSAMFVLFCLNYAEIPEEEVPWSPGVYNMMRLALDADIFIQPDNEIGNQGNLLFLDTDNNGNADRMAIVTDQTEDTITAIAGDWDDTVAEITFSASDSRMMGYINLQQLQETQQLENQPVPPMMMAPYSIDKDRNNIYTIAVYAYPVDATGKRITSMQLTDLGTFRVEDTTKINVESKFDTDLGEYHSAYFGTATRVSVDNIQSVWRNKQGNTYYLAYGQVNGKENNRWLNNSNTNTSLYLRYIPSYTVTFESDGFDSVIEKVGYSELPTITEPSTWTRESYTLVGWTVKGDAQNVYTYEEIMDIPITKDVTYVAIWLHEVTVNFHLGEYSNQLYPIDAMTIPYGETLSPMPQPTWRNDTIAMAFDGWYLDQNFTQPVTSDYQYFEDTILYAKWSPKEDGYYIYFMDFDRGTQTPLVLSTYSVTEGHTVLPYTPSNAPADTSWDGKWYLEKECINAYDFSIPVSQMTRYLTGTNGRDLYLYPGTQEICKAIFVTYGSKVDPVTVSVGESINLNQYVPVRTGYEFAGWALKDGTKVSGTQMLTETTTFYATWEASYVPFKAILRIENANDTGMTQADVIGTWYAKAGSQIRIKSTYSGSGNNRTGTHEVVCVMNGVEYPVYKNAALSQKATLSDVYETYFIYNNTGTTWTDEVNWDDIYTGGEVPYSTRPISSAGDTIINFDYMRVRNDIVFTIPNSSSGAYLDIYKLYRDGLITGSVTYTSTRPTTTGQNVSATGVSAENIRWSYTATTTGTNNKNLYTLHNMKYGQKIYNVYPVGGSWLTTRGDAFHWYLSGSTAKFSSRREDLSADFFSGSGRKLTPYSLTAVFSDEDKIALMYAIECLENEKADFTIGEVGYKVQTQLCEVVNHTGTFSQKTLLGCEKEGSNSYTNLNTTSSKLGNTSVKELFGTTYWDYYKIYDGVSSLSDIDKAYVFYYTRMHMNIQFILEYDSNGDGASDVVEYENIAFGEKLGEYQFAKPNYEQHDLLHRDGYEFVGWLDTNGFVLEEENWESMVATGDSENNTMIFIAKWEKISNNIVEYYEDRSSTEPFETHYFDDGELFQYPTMSVYPQGWVWQEYGEGSYERFDWDVPMYGEYGVQELRTVNGEERLVNVVRVYGTWDESHTKVVYDSNAAQGGIPDTAPVDSNEYTIWQSEVPVASKGNTANADPDMIFVGWKLNRNDIVYQPGDHVPVHWPRTMIFTAQWAKAEEVVYLRYDPNGGSPYAMYPNDLGFAYKKNATAAVWNNAEVDGTEWFTRKGYEFTGWNTKPDGSGTSYAPEASIILTQPETVLYAQWEKNSFTISLRKVDSETNETLSGAEFGLYKQEDGMFRLVQSLKTGVDGHITFLDAEIDTLYKLVEEKPPDGYAIISKEIYFKIKPAGNNVTLSFYDSEGNVISSPNGVTGEYITLNNLLNLTVKNLHGYKLPSTGGSGRFLYVLCGLLLMSAPFIFGFSWRRKCERRLKD